MANTFSNYVWLEGERETLEQALAEIKKGPLGAEIKDQGRALRLTFVSRGGPDSNAVPDLAQQFRTLVLTHVYYEDQNPRHGFAVYRRGCVRRWSEEGDDDRNMELPDYYAYAWVRLGLSIRPLSLKRSNAIQLSNPPGPWSADVQIVYDVKHVEQTCEIAGARNEL